MSNPPSVALGELMAKKSGSVDPSKFPDETFDLYSIPAFDSRQPEVTAGHAIGSSKQIVKSDDVLLSKIVPHIRRSWVVGEYRGRRLIASGEWIVFRSPRALPGYLRQVLVGDPFHTDFMRTVSGVGGSLLRARPAYVAEIKIPLPPLNEQRRIAEVLDRADALRAKRRAALAQLDSLTQSIFLDMFGDPATNPKAWPRMALGEIAVNGFQNGLYKHSSHYGTGTPILRIDAFYDGVVTGLDTLKRLRASTSEIETYGLYEGDVVVNRVNSIEYLGKSAIVPFLREPVVFESNMMRFAIDRKMALPSYVVAFLQSGFIKRQIGMAAKQAVNQASINQTDVTAFQVNIPPLSVQQAFVSRIAAIKTLKTIHRTALTELDALFASLQHRTFRGEL